MILCGAGDRDRIQNFYRYVTDRTDHMPKYGRWIYGLHPSDEMIRGYLDQDAMYRWEEDGDIVAVAAVTLFQPPEYGEVSWQVEAADDEVCAVHLLGVDPLSQNQGIATEVMKEIIDFARTKGKKAVRLDAIEGNLPAHKLYRSLEFCERGVRNWHAANLGYIDFYLYEYVV